MIKKIKYFLLTSVALGFLQLETSAMEDDRDNNTTTIRQQQTEEAKNEPNRVRTKNLALKAMDDDDDIRAVATVQQRLIHYQNRTEELQYKNNTLNGNIARLNTVVEEAYSLIDILSETIKNIEFTLNLRPFGEVANTIIKEKIEEVNATILDNAVLTRAQNMRPLIAAQRIPVDNRIRVPAKAILPGKNPPMLALIPATPIKPQKITELIDEVPEDQMVPTEGFDYNHVNEAKD